MRVYQGEKEKMKRILIGVAVLGLLGLYAPAQGAPLKRCDHLPSTIVGTHGPDVLRGTSEDDWISGLGGADVISGLGGDDVICGDRGKDIIYAHSKNGFSSCQGQGSVRLLGGQGHDRIWASMHTRMIGGGGDDTFRGCGPRSIVDYHKAPGPMVVRMWKGVAKGWGRDKLIGIDAVWGSVYKDFLIGSGSSEIFAGDEGDDFINGQGGSDEMYGNWGDDEIYGADGVAGNDILGGNDGSDSCLADESDVKYDCES